MEELKRERELAADDEDEKRWRVADAMRRSIGPRRYGPIQGY
jgi:hypothetical protein